MTPTPESVASNILAASPTLASAIALGLAWQRASAALPEDWSVFWLRWVRSTDNWTTEVIAGNGWRPGLAQAPTPEAALIALAEALEARRGE